MERWINDMSPKVYEFWYALFDGYCMKSRCDECVPQDDCICVVKAARRNLV